MTFHLGWFLVLVFISHGVDLNVDLIINIIISIRKVLPFDGNVFLVWVPRIVQLFSFLKWVWFDVVALLWFLSICPLSPMFKIIFWNFPYCNDLALTFLCEPRNYNYHQCIPYIPLCPQGSKSHDPWMVRFLGYNPCLYHGLEPNSWMDCCLIYWSWSYSYSLFSMH